MATYQIRDEFYQTGGDYLGNISEGVSAWKAIRGEEGIGRDNRCAWLTCLPALGNHENDTVGSNAEARMAAWSLGSLLNLPYQQTAEIDPDWKERYYYYTWGPVLMIWIDQYGYGGDGTWYLNAAQHKWLEDVLEAHRDYKFKVVCSHTTLHENDPNHTSNLANAPFEQAYLKDLLDQYGVQLYTHGHYHGWMHYLEASTGIRYLCTTFGAPRTQTTVDEWVSGTPAGRRYARVLVGWDEYEMRADPDTMSILITDPVTDVVTNKYYVKADDNPRFVDLPWSWDAQTPDASGGDVNMPSTMWEEFSNQTQQNTDFRLSVDGYDQSVRVDSMDNIYARLKANQFCGNDYLWSFKWKAETIGSSGYLAAMIRCSHPGNVLNSNNIYIEMGAVSSPSNNVRLIQRFTFNGILYTNTLAQGTYQFVEETEYRVKISIKDRTLKAIVYNSSDVALVSLDGGGFGYDIGENRNLHGKPGVKRSGLGGNTYRMWDFACTVAP